MGLEYYLLLATFILEACLYIKFIWKIIPLRNILAIAVLVSGSFVASFMLTAYFTPITWILAIITIYRSINLLRLINARMHDSYLRKATARTSISLFAAFVLSFTALIFVGSLAVNWANVLLAVTSILLLVSVFILFNSIRSIIKTKTSSTVAQLATSDLPTLTVAIPARNETQDLQDCLDAVLKSNYPKLEVLVLDDCSQLRRTPEIIKSYAHKGVRFIKGDVVAENWLAKNQAYNKLLNEANGEIVAFCGVDVRIDADSLYQTVNIMHARNKRMVSILPMRTIGKKLKFAPVQSLRYMWELAPPRRFFNRPAVLSSVWAIYRSDAKKLGGFKAVSRTILPERYFAKQMLASDSYSFLRASSGLAFFSVKKSDAQRSTAVRVRYPQVKRRPEAVMMLSLLMLTLFVAPYIVLVYAIYSVSVVLILLSLLVVTGVNLSYVLISSKTRTMSWYIAPIMHLPTVILDIILMHYSMYKYEFSEVVWKDRNVCVPVMHVIPKLPDLPEESKSHAV